MNLSNRLTFSLIFSILLFAAFAIVPTAMAAEGGPTVTSMELNSSQTKGGDVDNNATTPDEPMKNTVDNDNALLTTGSTNVAITGNRADLLDVAAAITAGTGTGYFQVIVEFNENVYQLNSAKPDDANNTDQSSTRVIDASDIASSDITIGAGNIKTGAIIPISGSGIEIEGVARVTSNKPAAHFVQTAGADTVVTTDDVYTSLRKFVVEIKVNFAVLDDLPISVSLKLNTANTVFGIGTNARVENGVFKPATLGIGNQASTQYNFTVVPRALSTLVVTGQPSGAIRSHEKIKLTLSFNPGLNIADVPTRTNLVVTNANILADDADTADFDEGIKDVSPSAASRTKYEVTILPEGGLGNTYTITLKNASGTSFTLNETFTVDNRPAAQRVTITSAANSPTDGSPFTVNFVYTVEPATALTVAGITVENGNIVAGSFAGSGKNYSVRVDPNNPTAGNPVTVTVRVGQDFTTFNISVAGTTPTPTPGDPHEAIEITLTAGLSAKDYLVITPAVIQEADASASPPKVAMNLDVLPTALTATMRETQATMPDLEALLYGGGTVDVYVDAGAGNTAADIIINEVMWGLDDNEVGTDGHTAHQWIELYNNSDENAAAGTITLWFKPRTLSGVPTDEGTRTDRLSNVLKYDLLRTGWSIAGKGQSGNSNTESPKEFISMYRLSNKRGDNDGINPASWVASTELSHLNHKGTPGKQNTRTSVAPGSETRPGLKADGSFDGGTFDKIVFWPSKSHVLINEVHNNSNNDLDWLELRFLQNANLENWTLSYVKSDRTEHEIMRFPKRGFSAGDILLIVNKDPRDTNLAAGQDVTVGSANQARGALDHKYWNPSGGNSGSGHYLDIPDYNGGDYLLVLRTGKGWERFGSRDRLHDVVGTGTFGHKTLSSTNPSDVKREPHTKFAKSNGGDDKGYIWETETWPINGHARGKGLSNRASNAGGSNNGNSLLQNDRKLSVGSVLARNGTAHGWGKDGIYYPGNRGGLGYDRGVVANGTPGYDNGVVKGKHTDLGGGQVYVSELMLTTDSGRYPQWIELHNTSNNTVDLHADTDGNGSRQGWSIRVENNRSDTWDSRRRDKLHVEVKFRDLGVRFIPPNQTILITADKVRNSSASHFPAHRVASIWGTSAKNMFKMENRRDIFLNLKGFRLEVVDGSGQVSDAVGNLDGKSPTVFNDVGFDNPSDNGAWNWPSEADMIVNNRRTSLIRLYDDGVPRMGTPTGPESTRGAILPIGKTIWDGDGMKEDGTANPEHRAKYAKYADYAWVHAVDTKLAKAQITWYGSDDDHGTPLHTTGTPLPVSLSFFRPTLEENQIVIRWTTESELDNAGFNILRSESRTGEFTQVNEQLIQGQGTTAERSTYKWVDTSAKPGAVYYYQIEDVSFAGEHTQLATTKLKGLISAKNKLTTTWSELKEVQ